MPTYPSTSGSCLNRFQINRDIETNFKISSIITQYCNALLSYKSLNQFFSSDGISQHISNTFTLLCFWWANSNHPIFKKYSIRWVCSVLPKSNSFYLKNSETSILKGHVRIKYRKSFFKDRMHVNMNKIRWYCCSQLIPIVGQF